MSISRRMTGTEVVGTKPNSVAKTEMNLGAVRSYLKLTVLTLQKVKMRKMRKKKKQTQKARAFHPRFARKRDRGSGWKTEPDLSRLLIFLFDLPSRYARLSLWKKSEQK